MKQDTTRPVLQLSHKRSKLIAPLLAAQLIVATGIYCIYAYLQGELSAAYLPLLLFASATAGPMYIYATIYFVSRLINTHYFTLHEDGAAVWRRLFATRFFQYPPGVRWRIEDRKVRFDDFDGQQPDTIDLPPTLASPTFK